jgi:lipopolysaccharide transport system ATP-binding protein
MGEVSKGEGRTILFVSHNMAAVKTLCQSGIVLKHGLIDYTGTAVNSVSRYLSGESESLNHRIFGAEAETDQFKIKELAIHPKTGGPEDSLDEYQEITFTIQLHIKKDAARLHIAFVLKNENGEELFTFGSKKSNATLVDGENRLSCYFPESFLNIGSYYLDMYVIEDAKRAVFTELDVLAFSIQEGQRNLGAWMGKEHGFIKPRFDWANQTT